jgi:N-acetylglucosamine-6-phosphate deacetylase
MNRIVEFRNATVVFPDRTERVERFQIHGSLVAERVEPKPDEVRDLKGLFLLPGFVDLHVHGGGGADFMDLTSEAFRTVCRTHAKHGTTSLTPTSTVANETDTAAFLDLCRTFRDEPTGGARIVGAHHYGPYFSPEARGCHPTTGFQRPDARQVDAFIGFDDSFPLTVTIAPELPNAEELTRACRDRGIRVNIGHSFATMEQVEAAIGWGARHVDHLFCAMSDRARLRQKQTYPMRAGVMEATLYRDELTTEVIADGKHLNDALLRLAWKFKGSDRLALVTDSMRAVDLPDGEYWFGPEGRGERIRKHDGVGVTLDGTALASGVMGLDHCVRTMLKAPGAPLYEVVRSASLTPARILGLDREIGSIEPGKRADLLVTDADLNVREVWINGVRLETPRGQD